MEQETIDRIAEAVASRVLPVEHRLWDGDACAAYLGCTPRYFQTQIAVVPSFPKARRVPTTKGRMHPRYAANEVIEWAMANG